MSLDPKRVVVKISKRTLSEDEERVLTLGLNFAVAPKQVPYESIIAATEATARQLKPEVASELRKGVSEALSKARPPQSNVDKGMRRAIRGLQEDTEIVILPADKGNATVVMEKSEYISKMNTMLEDATYVKLKKDPTSKVERKITNATGQGLHRRQGEEAPFTSMLITTTDVWPP